MAETSISNLDSKNVGFLTSISEKMYHLSDSFVTCVLSNTRMADTSYMVNIGFLDTDSTILLFPLTEANRS